MPAKKQHGRKGEAEPPVKKHTRKKNVPKEVKKKKNDSNHPAKAAPSPLDSAKEKVTCSLSTLVNGDSDSISCSCTSLIMSLDHNAACMHASFFCWQVKDFMAQITAGNCVTINYLELMENVSSVFATSEQREVLYTSISNDKKFAERKLDREFAAKFWRLRGNKKLEKREPSVTSMSIDPVETVMRRQCVLFLKTFVLAKFPTEFDVTFADREPKFWDIFISFVLFNLCLADAKQEETQKVAMFTFGRRKRKNKTTSKPKPPKRRESSSKVR
jgi:hypothetical protein